MKIFRAEPLHSRCFDGIHLELLDRLFVESKREGPDLNQRTFDQDFANIFLYANRHSERLFKIASNDEELTERLLSNVQTEVRFDSVDDTVCDWVAQIVWSLVRSGAAYYSLNEDAERGDIHIVPFGSSGVACFFRTCVQWVPRHARRLCDRDDEKFPREIRILDSAKVMRFIMPKAIKRILAAQRKALAVLDKHQFEVDNLLPRATYKNPNPTMHFDFSVWQRTQERVLYRSTRTTGWDGGKSDLSKRSDFFECHRMIRFRRNQLLLRNDVFRQLSTELTKVGRGYNAQYNLEISGTDELPSVEHLNELEAKLNREDVSFSEIIDYCYKR